MSLVVVLATVFALLERCAGNSGDAFGLINKVQTYCEYDAITMGSKLSDYYNSLDEATHKIDRMHIPFIMEHLGFGWDHAAFGRQHAALGLAPDSSSVVLQEVKASQKKGGWSEELGVASSAYAPLHNKWIYFYGDATLRQLALTFLLPYHDKEMANYKEMLHTKCENQQHRELPAATGSDSASGSDGHHAPHHLKAKTCNFSGFGEKGKLTYDWKHSPYDEYDKWAFGPEGLWPADSVAHTSATDATVKQFPDVMVIQIGHSTCLPSSETENANTHLHLEDSVIRDHHSQVDALFDAIKAAVERPQSTKTGAKTTVIVSTPGRVNLLNRKAERCVWQFNRIIAKAAHKRGFVVFEREEIEHRVGFKVESSQDLRDLGVLDAAEAPTSHIVATALLTMISCLAKGDNAAAKTVV